MGDHWPTPASELESLKGSLDAAIIAANNNGKLKTAQKNVARAALIDGLDKDASYVDIICNGDERIIMQAGFEAVSANRAQTMLSAPQLLAVDPLQAGQLKVRIRAARNTKSIVGQIKKVNDPAFGPSVTFASSRDIIFRGLTAGATYVIQLMGIGGSTGQSDWSNPGQGVPK